MWLVIQSIQWSWLYYRFKRHWISSFGFFENALWDMKIELLKYLTLWLKENKGSMWLVIQSIQWSWLYYHSKRNWISPFGFCETVLWNMKLDSLNKKSYGLWKLKVQRNLWFNPFNGVDFTPSLKEVEVLHLGSVKLFYETWSWIP